MKRISYEKYFERAKNKVEGKTSNKEGYSPIDRSEIVKYLETPVNLRGYAASKKMVEKIRIRNLLKHESVANEEVTISIVKQLNLEEYSPNEYIFHQVVFTL
jgi:hypothetical protein